MGQDDTLHIHHSDYRVKHYVCELVGSWEISRERWMKEWIHPPKNRLNTAHDRQCFVSLYLFTWELSWVLKATPACHTNIIISLGVHGRDGFPHIDSSWVEMWHSYCMKVFVLLLIHPSQCNCAYVRERDWLNNVAFYPHSETERW